MNVIARIQDQASLAMVYANDGALHSAARILRELAEEIEQQAVNADKFLDAMIAEGKVEGAAGKPGA